MNVKTLQKELLVGGSLTSLQDVLAVPGQVQRSVTCLQYYEALQELERLGVGRSLQRRLTSRVQKYNSDEPLRVKASEIKELVEDVARLARR